MLDHGTGSLLTRNICAITNTHLFVCQTYEKLQPFLCCRIGSCIILKLFLIWVLGNSASGNGAYPVWKGWVIAASLGCTGYLLTLLHHQIFWCVCLKTPAPLPHPEHCM